MNHGGCRISTRRESTRTAFAVYYSTTKKTALPLNETCTRRPFDTFRRNHVIKMEANRAHARNATTIDTHIAEIKKHTMK
jgi:hypothetical protein